MGGILDLVGSGADICSYRGKNISPNFPALNFGIRRSRIDFRSSQTILPRSIKKTTSFVDFKKRYDNLKIFEKNAVCDGARLEFRFEVALGYKRFDFEVVGR